MARPGDGDKTAFFPAARRRTSQAARDARAALCLHGFTGTPFEVRPIAEGLAAQGFTVLAPVLAGHGGTVAELASTRFDRLAGLGRAGAAGRCGDEVDGGPVAIAGFSLGGLLALRLAHRHPDWVAALAVLAAPLRLRPLEVAAVRAWMRLPPLPARGPAGRSCPRRAASTLFDDDMARLNPSLPAMPLAGVHSLIELGALVPPGPAQHP